MILRSAVIMYIWVGIEYIVGDDAISEVECGSV